MCIDELRLKDRSILGALRPGKRHFQTFGFCRVYRPIKFLRVDDQSLSKFEIKHACKCDA